MTGLIKSKKFILLAVVLVLALGAGGCYYWWRYYSQAAKDARWLSEQEDIAIDRLSELGQRLNSQQVSDEEKLNASVEAALHAAHFKDPKAQEYAKTALELMDRNKSEENKYDMGNSIRPRLEEIAEGKY